ncbi:MAG: hypothetical protein R2879_08860 [Saprospiraceae bacterium]
MEDFKEYIEDYWDGNLHGDKLEAFVHEMDANKEFRELVMLHQQVRESLRNDLVHERQQGDLKETLTGLNHKYFNPRMTKPGKGFNLKAFIVLLIITLLVAFLVYFLWPSGASQLDRVFDMPIASLTLKGTNDEGLNSKAETAFNNGNYEEALDVLQELKLEHPMDAEVLFFEALSQLKTGNVQVAVDQLSSLSAGDSGLKYDAQWYLVLAYHQLGNEEAVNETLGSIPEDSPYYQKAEILLKDR